MEEESSDKNVIISNNIEFKKPVLVGKIGKLPRKAKCESETVSDEKSSGKTVELEEKKSAKLGETSSDEKPKSSLPPAVLLRELSTPIPYKEPKWSGLPHDGTDYALEVLKSGMIIERIDLMSKPYYVFGRLANCDVVMAHPTISRHHIVLQYKAFASEGEPPPGWYIYDLSSTHGTTLNRERVKPNHYTRVRVGHQIKLGQSSRVHILCGPDFDCDGESELTVTEIKQKALEMKLNRNKMIQEAIEQRERDRVEEERKREEQGIDWGMGEDAEEETDLSENPFAATTNEELYLEDPKKTLRGYFEREGHELTYDCEERGVGQFLCKVELPIDDARGNPVMAEVMHRGKKKEAVIACALEACRILDRAGLLRQAKHESRRRKQRDYSVDDYYSSDEDTFLDRTGAVEKKRENRMKQGKPKEALSYDDLLKQSSDLQKKIEAEERAIAELREALKPAPKGEEVDSLDEFMRTTGNMSRKAELSSCKMKLQSLRSELSRTQRLAEVARPAHLPPLIKKDDRKPAVKASGKLVYGKRIRLKEDEERKKKVREEKKQQEDEFVEEVDSDDEIQNNEEKIQSCNLTEETDKSSEDSGKCSEGRRISGGEKGKNSGDKGKSSKASGKCSEESGTSSGDSGKYSGEKGKSSETSGKSEENKKVYGPMRPPENYTIPENYFDQESDRDLPVMEE